MGILDFAYLYHPRLHVFYVVQMIFTAAVAIAGALTITAACRSKGQIPFLQRGMVPKRCACYCVAVGIIVILLLSNLTVMIGCHTGMSRGLRQLPDVYSSALADLRLYVNRTTYEIFNEIEKGDHGASLIFRRLISDVLRRTPAGKTVPCRVKSGALALSGRRCGDSPADNVTDLWEDLDRLHHRAITSIDAMEKKSYSFENATAYWTHAKLLGFHVIPLVIVIVCIVATLMGFGVGYAVRNYVYWFMPPSVAMKHAGVLILATAAVIVVFYLLASVLLIIMVTASFLANHYVCKPYRDGAYHQLHDLYLMTWCHGGNGGLFYGLLPEQVLSRCGDNGTSFVALAPYSSTAGVGGQASRMNAKMDSGDEQINASLANHTIGKCRPVYDILRVTIDTFCDVLIDSMLGVTLSLAVSMVMLLGVLPLLLALSQHFFMIIEDDDPSIGDNEMPFEPENSQEELVSGSGDHCDKESKARERFRLMKWCRPKVMEIYPEEGVGVIETVSRPDSVKDAGGLRKAWKRLLRLYGTRITKHIQERPLIPKAEPSSGSANSPKPAPRNVPTLGEMFPHLSNVPQIRHSRPKGVACRKTSRKTTLKTIEEEPESAESSETSSLSLVGTKQDS